MNSPKRNENQGRKRTPNTDPRGRTVPANNPWLSVPGPRIFNSLPPPLVTDAREDTPFLSLPILRRRKDRNMDGQQQPQKG